MKVMICFFLLAFVSDFTPIYSISAKEYRDISLNELESKSYGEGRMLENEDAFLTVPEIIKKYGYPIEVHNVTTADGYILEMHRIPYGKYDTPSEGRPVVWLQHGFICDSSNWIMNNEHQAIAYVLANMGYDVWMGNARGNTYSKRHLTLNNTDSVFWQFSYHEMGVYDIPAVFDYVLAKTNQPDLYYVGHSMGTKMFFVAMSEYPELNSKVRLMTALAPVVYVEHMQSPITILAPFLDQIAWLIEFIGLNEFAPTGPFMDLLGRTVCAATSPIQSICNNVFFLIGGYNAENLNRTAVPIIVGHMPSGSSSKTVIHFAQEYKSGEFRQYDYGRRENLVRYGTDYPPAYNLSRVTVPVAVYWGQNDWLADTADVYRTTEELPNVVRKYRVRNDQYSHFDFVFALDNDVLLNNEIIKYIKLF